MDQKCRLAGEKNFPVPCKRLLTRYHKVTELHNVLVSVGVPTTSVRAHRVGNHRPTAGRGCRKQRCRPTLEIFPDAWGETGPYCFRPIGVELVDLGESEYLFYCPSASTWSGLVRQIAPRSTGCCPSLDGPRVNQREGVDLEVNFEF